jgi:dUTP pyrophosphatase
MLELKFKKLNENAVAPKRATPGSAAFDIVGISKKEVYHEVYANLLYIEYKTGLAFEIPPGHVGLLFPRSSISNYSLSLCNAVGILDSDFRGEVTFRFKPTSSGQYRNFEYKDGNKIGQLVIMPIPEVELKEVQELSSTERDIGGYGSTGI